MTAVTTMWSVLTRVLYRRPKVWALVTVASMVLGCSLESTLDSLADQFPKYKSELNSLISVWQALHSEVSLKGYMSGQSRSCKEPPCIRIGNGEEVVPLKVAMQRFPKSSEQLIQLAKLAENIKLDYLSLEVDEYFVIVMKGGGTLASDAGYLFMPRGSSPTRAAKYFKPISNENYWYAFVG
jgi:hypothetical protein